MIIVLLYIDTWPKWYVLDYYNLDCAANTWTFLNDLQIFLISICNFPGDELGMYYYYYIFFT